MSYTEAFKKKGLLKILLISLSIVMWIFFYKSSNISLTSLIVFNLSDIVNTFLTLDFLFFLLLFPITSAICIALSVEKEKNLDLLEVFIGITLGFIISFLIFRFSTNFWLFALFYLISHLILSILTFNKFKERNHLISLSNYANSKISILLSLTLFLVIFLVILPSQASYSQKMQIGIVEVFVGDDIGNWLGTSYSISKASTASVVTFIAESPEYINLKKLQDPVVYKYIDFIEDIKDNSNNKDSSKDFDRLYANLNTDEVKNKVLGTISSIPLMVVINKFFALFFAIMIASMAQIYFSIAFSLLGLLYVYIFYRVFNSGVVKKE